MATDEQYVGTTDLERIRRIAVQGARGILTADDVYDDVVEVMMDWTAGVLEGIRQGTATGCDDLVEAWKVYEAVLTIREVQRA